MAEPTSNLCDGLGVPHDWDSVVDYRDDPATARFVCFVCGVPGRVCSTCDGLGTLAREFQPEARGGVSVEVRCPTCEGWGVVPAV